MINGLVEAPVQQSLIAKGTDQIAVVAAFAVAFGNLLTLHLLGQVEPMQRVEKEQRSYFVVEAGT